MINGLTPYYSDDAGAIYCGDCLEIMKHIPDKSVDLVLTDPPYFLPVQHYVGTRKKGYPKRTLADTSVLRGYFAQVLKEADRITTPEGTLYVFCDGQSYPIFYQELFPYCKHVRPLIWDKMVSYNGYTWRHGHELIAWGEREQTKRVPTGDGDILRCRGVLQADRLHPAEKPVELLKKLIAKHDYETVIDLYAGSGSTCKAAQELGRKYIGIEISPEYCEIAKSRLADKGQMSLFGGKQ